MSDDYDLVVVGAGPAGLLCAIACAGFPFPGSGRAGCSGGSAPASVAALASRGSFSRLQIESCTGAGSGEQASDSRGGSPRILVLEKMSRPGLKLLATGSGRCNLTHAGDIADFFSHYRPAAARFLKPALLGFTNEALLDFFRSQGSRFVTEESGKIFPESGGAAGLRDILLRLAGTLGIEIRTQSALRRALRRITVRAEGGFSLQVESKTAPAGREVPVTMQPVARQTLAAEQKDSQCSQSSGATLGCRSLCLATGGTSWPGTGSTGDGYALARSLGHGIVEPRPALAPIFVRSWAYAAASGFALRARMVRVLRAGKPVAQGFGDVLFTHEGLSGPGILDLSGRMLPGDELRFPLVEVPDEASADSLLLQAIAAGPKRKLQTMLGSLGLSESLARALAFDLGLDPDATAGPLTRDARKALSAALGAFRVPVDSIGGFPLAMLTAGGLRLDEVHSKTMESRLVPGLYFAGEILDVDGDTGGYNLQAAFATGALAGTSARARMSVGPS